MKLRKWQSECVTKALNHYASINKHFLCLATPGAGKTIMAAEVAFELYRQKKIDFVLCFSPSTSVSESIKKTFSQRFGLRFDGVIGAIGSSFTYQSILFFKPDFWELLQNNRVLVIFDEIHHCAGTSPENSNAWGEEIIQKIQNQSTYTFALTGTPWRSDNSPIVLSSYTDTENIITCDYTYGLKDAVNDGVCRNPKIVLVDNERITVTEDDKESKTFTCFGDLLKESKVSYPSIISNYDVIRHILTKGCKKLAQIRIHTPNAGGLVVASSVKHASWILEILTKELNQSAVLATYKQTKPTRIIDNYKLSSTEWIVSVGMISEGTDIPRLQVCCHLSHVKTELYFRQVLGRILRVTSSRNQDAWLYTFAEPKLSKFAKRVDVELPEQDVCRVDYFVDENCLERNYFPIEIERMLANSQTQEVDDIATLGVNSIINPQVTINYSFDILGSYRQQVIATFNSAF
jgi:superfamily II DNA or RNA helicase